MVVGREEQGLSGEAKEEFTVGEGVEEVSDRCGG